MSHAIATFAKPRLRPSRLRVLRAASLALTALVLTLVLGAPAPADITVETTMRVGATPRVVLSSSLGASKWDAFVAGVQAAQAIGRFVSAVSSSDPYSGASAAYDSYRRIREFLEQLEDKVETLYEWRSVRRGDPSMERVTLTFSPRSNDDPFGSVRVARPNLPGFSGALGETVTRPSQTPNPVTVTLDLRPNSGLADGTYTILFSCKETDCGTCLSVVHVVTITVGPSPFESSPCRELLQKAIYSANLAARWRMAIHAELMADRGYYDSWRRAEAEKWACLRRWEVDHPKPGWSEESKIREHDWLQEEENWRVRRAAEVASCERNHQIEPGRCPQVARGVRDASTCERLQRMSLELWAAADLAKWAADSVEACRAGNPPSSPPPRSPGEPPPPPRPGRWWLGTTPVPGGDGVRDR